MDKRNLALSLLFLVILVSGCINDSSSSTTRDDKGSVTIHKLTVEPDEIYEDSSVRASLDLVNTGNQPAVINAGEGGEGREVLKDHCPDIFTIPSGGDGFQAQPQELEDGGSAQLHPGQGAKLRWKLQQEGNVPLYGFTCDLKFEIPFQYKVSAYRQVQVKNSRTVEGTDNLRSESSSGPLLFAIETIGGTGEEGKSTYITGEDESMRVLLQLQNTKKVEYNKGVVDIDDETLTISSDPPLEISYSACPQSSSVNSGKARVCREARANVESKCELRENTELKMFEGESRIIACDVDIPESIDDPSKVVEIRASVQYTYLKDGGTRTVEVKHSGE